MEKNEILTVTIEDMGSAGEGIGRADGYTLFVKDAVIGDTVETRIVKAKKKYAYARLERVLEPSPFRVEPRCPYARQCGGCQLQAMSYERQLIYKQNKIRGDLIHLGGFREEEADAVLEPIVGMEEPFRYRNKAQYPVGTARNGEPVTGFYAGRTHTIIPNTDCCLGREENKEILEKILAYLKENRVPAFNEETGKGLIRHILIRTGFDSGQIMVCLILNVGPGSKGGQGKKAFLPAQEKLIGALRSIPGMTSISVNLNAERTNVIMGRETHTLWGEEKITDSLYLRDVGKGSFERTGEKVSFRISPVSFYQVNPQQTEKLYSLALAYAGLTGKETVWDIYCGIGTISLFLAAYAGKVYGVEAVERAVEDARENARLNGIENAEFFAGKAEEVLPELYEKEGIWADVIVVDPPRKGCDSAVLDTMLKMRPERIVYVSCDPATLARDLKVLREGGYEVKRGRGVDQFGGTVHVETVCFLARKA